MTTGSFLLDRHLLSVLIGLPLVGAAGILFLPKDRRGDIRNAAFLVALAEFLISLLVVARFDPGSASMQLFESVPWFPRHGIGYIVGVDGISLWLLMLTTFITPIAILSSFPRSSGT